MHFLKFLSSRSFIIRNVSCELVKNTFEILTKVNGSTTFKTYTKPAKQTRMSFNTDFFVHSPCYLTSVLHENMIKYAKCITRVNGITFVKFSISRMFCNVRYLSLFV